MNHFITKCKLCEKVINQCRCPSESKTVNYEVCSSCEDIRTETNTMIDNIVNQIFSDISDRKGFEVDDLEADIQGEIKETWYNIILDNLCECEEEEEPMQIDKMWSSSTDIHLKVNEIIEVVNQLTR